jgi:chromosome segregation ATPase
MADPKTPPTASTPVEDAAAYYKSLCEQLENELAEFQSSSRDLETQLEKDVEEAEKRERRLKEKVDNLSYEVEEWKVCLTMRYLQARVLTIMPF